nr:heat stress transcription factor B-2b [Ipomoea trifida]
MLTKRKIPHYHRLLPSRGPPPQLLPLEVRLVVVQLYRKLNWLKGFCHNIYNMMSNYAVNPSESTSELPYGRTLDFLLASQGAAEHETTAAAAAEDEGVKAEDDGTCEKYPFTNFLLDDDAGIGLHRFAVAGYPIFPTARLSTTSHSSF